MLKVGNTNYLKQLIISTINDQAPVIQCYNFMQNKMFQIKLNSYL